jgi:hemerythrin
MFLEWDEKYSVGVKRLDDQHKKKHRYFVGHVEGFRKEWGGGSPELAKDVLQFLRKWLTAHILGKDMKYRSFFNEKGLIGIFVHSLSVHGRLGYAI